MNFSEVFSMKRLVGKVSLRRKLYKKAVEDEDTKMLTLLAKNWLGMSEKQDVSLTSPIEIKSSEYNLKLLTEEELLQLKALLAKATPHAEITNSNRGR